MSKHRTPTDKTDTHHDLGGNPGGIPDQPVGEIRIHVGSGHLIACFHGGRNIRNGDHGKNGRAQADQDMRSQSGRLLNIFPLHADDGP